MVVPSRIASLFKALPLVGVLLIALIAPGAIALGQSPAEAGEPVIVVTSPWHNALAVATRADGRLIAPGRVGSVAMVWSEDPAFTEALYAEGAWFVLNADLSGVLCAVE